MRKANENEIRVFKENHCRNEALRAEINNLYDVEVESFEELLPGKTVTSYATGGREIEGSFIIFHVIDYPNDVEYFPVFSESVGRTMLRGWGMPVPRKRSIFLEENDGGNGGGYGDGNGGAAPGNGAGNRTDPTNSSLRKLILFARSMMILHVDDPKPMDGALKDIYETLESDPTEAVRASQIKSINTAIGSHLGSYRNTNHNNFENLQGYIEFLRESVRGRRLRNANFDALRNILAANYPGVQIYF